MRVRPAEEKAPDPAIAWRFAKVAGAIDTLVRLLDTALKAQPMLTFIGVGKQELALRDLAGIARSVQAATSFSEGDMIDETDLESLEKRFAVVEADARAMLTQLGKSSGVA